MHTVDCSNNQFDFAAYSKARRELIEKRLAKYFTQSEASILWESMTYSVLSEGKKLRGLLCIASAEAIAGSEIKFESILPLSCAIEIIHAMSLIHDDLPALDNDDYRRGKLTNHKVYGEAIALLAGDALLMLAVETVIEKTPKNIDRQLLLNIVSHLCRATGAAGMVGGQVLDLSFTGKLTELQNSRSVETDKEVSTLEAIHKGKTGALIKFAVWSGASLAGANKKQLLLLEQFADKLGYAFQIADDLLDSTGNLVTLGKTPGKDQASSKVTWVTVFGEKLALQKLHDLEKDGMDILDNSELPSKNTVPLRELLKYAIYRTS